MTKIWKRESQEPLGSSLSLDTANELDNLASKRSGEYHEEVDFVPILSFQKKLNNYLQELSALLKTDKRIPYNYLFNNPPFTASLRLYGLSKDSYFREGITTEREYLSEIHIGLRHVQKSLDYVVNSPDKAPLHLMNRLVNFCCLLGEEERNAEQEVKV